MQNKKIALVTGAKGMLGQDLCPILEDEGFEVIETDIDTLDITDIEAVKKVFLNYKPDFIFHCAAYTNVDLAEDCLETARKINACGTSNVAKVAAQIDATLFYISTDYVFDGTKGQKYLPNDIVNPINNYGLTKLEGEIAVQKFCKKYYIARTSWLYGHHGKNFVETMIKISKNEEIKVVDDQIGCPTWTCDLARALVKLLDMPYGIYHTCGGSKTSWYSFAREIYDKMGIKANLIPCKTCEFQRKARRPACSVMENSGLLRNWKLALFDYINLRLED